MMAKERRKSASAILTGLFCFLSILLFTAGTSPAQGETGELLETEEAAETAERIRVLEAQRIRQDERASLWGGTGLVFTRTAVLLPRKHFNASAYFNFSHFQDVQGWREAYKLDDPRENDYELNLVANYGLTHWAEVGMFMNFFLQDEEDDGSQLHMRSRGIGWSGINAKFRLMDIDKDGLGIATTFYLRFPSPQSDSDITSRDLNYGAELNVSLKLMVVTEWLEKFTIHGNFGYAHLDYFDTGLAGLYQFVRTNDLLSSFASRTDKYRNDYYYYELFDPTWGPDDYEMEHLYFATDHYTGSFAVEYRPIAGLSTGFELVGYRMIKFSDDNLQIAPFVTYTFRQIPFIKKLRKDIATVSLAGNFGLRAKNRSAPQYGIVAGITYHTDLIF